jgi:hypothetical protein
MATRNPEHDGIVNQEGHGIQAPRETARVDVFPEDEAHEGRQEKDAQMVSREGQRVAQRDADRSPAYRASRTVGRGPEGHSTPSRVK